MTKIKIIFCMRDLVMFVCAGCGGFKAQYL